MLLFGHFSKLLNYSDAILDPGKHLCGNGNDI